MAHHSQHYFMCVFLMQVGGERASPPAVHVFDQQQMIRFLELNFIYRCQTGFRWTLSTGLPLRLSARDDNENRRGEIGRRARTLYY